MNRSRALGALGAALIAASVAIWIVPVAYAQTSSPALATGWWTQQPGAQPIVDDGFEVAWALEREVSMAAVRLDTSAAAGGTVFLVLQEIGGNATDQGYVDVCPTTANSWTADNPGAYGDRPESDCTVEGTVRLGRDLGTKQWAGDVTGLVNSAGITSLAVRPAGKPFSGSSGPSAPFQVRFGAAELRYDPPATAPTQPTSSAPPETFSFGDDNNAQPPNFEFPGAGGGFDSSGFGPVITSTTIADTTATTAATTSSIDRRLATASGSADRPWGRLAVLVPFSSGIGLIATSIRRMRSLGWTFGEHGWVWPFSFGS